MRKRLLFLKVDVSFFYARHWQIFVDPWFGDGIYRPFMHARLGPQGTQILMIVMISYDFSRRNLDYDIDGSILS